MKAVNAVINKIPKNINYKKWFIISLVLIFISLMLCLVVIPVLTKVVVKHLLILKPMGYLRSKHEKEIPLTYKLFLWNVTNPKGNF